MYLCWKSSPVVLISGPIVARARFESLKVSDEPLASITLPTRSVMAT